MRWAWLVLVCLLPACGSQPVKAPVGDHSARPVRSPGYHWVRQGDTLYSVAFLYGYSVEELASWNQLRAPYTIYKNQQLRIRPPAKSKVRSTLPAARVSRPGPSLPKPSQPKPRASTKTSSTITAPATRSRPTAVPASPSTKNVASSAPVSWSWPAKGRLIQRYNPGNSGGKGIDISGKNGESVRAAAAGKVVYAGSGLSGYGRLIIIKHNKDFLSAYAHNRKLIAKEGQWVKKGETIARMGSSDADRTKLHFEIRKRGRPVDPLRYLPGR